MQTTEMISYILIGISILSMLSAIIYWMLGGKFAARATKEQTGSGKINTSKKKKSLPAGKSQLVSQLPAIFQKFPLVLMSVGFMFLLIAVILMLNSQSIL